jgi:hypothetical protein
MPWRRMLKWKYSSIILDLGTRWRWMVSFTPRPFYLLEKSPRDPLGEWVDPRAGLDSVQKRRFFLLPGIEPRQSSSSLYRLSYPNSRSSLYCLFFGADDAPTPAIVIVYFLDIPQSLLGNARILFWIGHDHFLLNTFKLFRHPSIRFCVL